MSIRVSPISRTAAILIVVVGVIVLFAGLLGGDTISAVAGIAFITLGLVLYGLLFRFTKRVLGEQTP